MANVLIDGNYIFHKTLGVFGGYGKVDPAEVLRTEGEQAMFLRKIATDLCAMLKNLPVDGRVIFTIDSMSWRKQYYPEYKERDKDEEIDWGVFYHLLATFGEHLEQNHGFICSKSNGAEGDDLIYIWSRYLNAQGEDVIIVSGDKDLHQLVGYSNNNENWTVVWNSNSKNHVLSVPEGWEDKVKRKGPKKVTIFDVGEFVDDENDKLSDLIMMMNEINIVDRKKFLFIKILEGDKGDNVPSVWLEETTTSTGKQRVNRVTPAKAEKIYESFLESKWKNEEITSLAEDKEFHDWLGRYAIKTLKGIDSSENREIAKENVDRNFVLMLLDKKSLPRDVVQSIFEDIKKGMSLPKNPVTTNRNAMMEGTPWEKEDKNIVPKGHNPFNLM